MNADQGVALFRPVARVARGACGGADACFRACVRMVAVRVSALEKYLVEFLIRF